MNQNASRASGAKLNLTRKKKENEEKITLSKIKYSKTHRLA